MPFLRVNGAGLHYTRSGAGEPLLWLPGFAISSMAWQPVEHHYAAAFDCIAFDNRATGRSGPSRRVISIPQLAGDAVGGLDALGIESAHVYGVSYGGGGAQGEGVPVPPPGPGAVPRGTPPRGPPGAPPPPP